MFGFKYDDFDYNDLEKNLDDDLRKIIENTRTGFVISVNVTFLSYNEQQIVTSLFDYTVKPTPNAYYHEFEDRFRTNLKQLWQRLIGLGYTSMRTKVTLSNIQ